MVIVDGVATFGAANGNVPLRPGDPVGVRGRPRSPPFYPALPALAPSHGEQLCRCWPQVRAWSFYVVPGTISPQPSVELVLAGVRCRIAPYFLGYRWRCRRGLGGLK